MDQYKFEAEGCPRDSRRTPEKKARAKKIKNAREWKHSPGAHILLDEVNYCNEVNLPTLVRYYNGPYYSTVSEP